MKKLSSNTVFFTFLLTAHIALVWMLPYFPTQDGPSHMYNLVILHDLLNGGKDWGDFYTYRLQATPNLSFHLIAYPLLRFFSPLAVEKIFVSLYIFLMGVSVPVFIKTFSGKVFPFAYLVFPVMFNFCLMMGFYSYVITVPCFLLAVSASWEMRNRSVPQKMLLFNAMGIALFYLHLIPAVLYIMSLAIMAIVEAYSLRESVATVLKYAGITAPWLLIFSLYMWRGFSFSGHSLPVIHIPEIDLSRDFFSFSTVTFGSLQQIAAEFLLFLVLFFFSVYLFETAKKFIQKRISASDMPRQEIFLLGFLVSLIFLYFFAPFNFGEGSFFNQRFPWVILLIMLPLLRIPEKIRVRRLFSIIAASAALVFFIFNCKVLSQQSDIVSEFLRGSVADFAEGSYIMLYRYGNSGWSRADVLLHAASYYGMEKKCVDIGNYEVSYNLFPVKYRRNVSSLPAWDKVEYEPETIRWDKYPAIDYLLAWKADRVGTDAISRFFHVVWKDESLTVWRRNSRNVDNTR